ncbi:MAG: hypothetical protein NUV74_01040 [Candidatus Brocadiaceae bacterium]|nr:hypothetical protein [Candidatus Brocadiaceae bacterium]
MKDNSRVYNLYGLRVHSEIELPAPIAQSDLPPYDLQVCWGECKAISDDAPAGEILAKLVLDDGRGYTLTDTGIGYALYFHQTCEFWIDHDLRSVRAHRIADVHPDMAALFFVGNVIACILTLAGECVLHASAIEIGDSALAFAGGSGMGKSTLAALFCAGGARFVTDDLLRLQPKGKGWRCFSGTGEIRLRKNAAALAENFSATAHGTHPDGRIAIKMDGNQSMVPLGTIVIPYPSRHGKELKLQRLPRSMALLYLMAFPRIQGLQQGKHLQRRLDSFGRIAASIPIFKAEIPWGLPFPRDLVHSLARGVEAHLHSRHCFDGVRRGLYSDTSIND